MPYMASPKLEHTRLDLLHFTTPFENTPYLFTQDLKDPCVVQVGEVWHLYGSAGSSQREEWQIFHATARSPDGPWDIQPPVILAGLQTVLGEASSTHIAAPSVVYDEATAPYGFHMVVQSEFLKTGGKILYFQSRDGQLFEQPHVLLGAIDEPGSEERGVYDPHFAVIQGKKYFCYSGARKMERLEHQFTADPDIYLAESTTGTWLGPWERRGRILSHEEIPHHNPRGHHDYEWGLEGSQLIELPSGLILMIAVCFKPQEVRGLRQRIFFAAAKHVHGPYKTLGIAIEPSSSVVWNSGENGHAMGSILYHPDGLPYLRVWHQGRPHPSDSIHWSHRFADFRLEHIEELAQAVHAS